MRAFFLLLLIVLGGAGFLTRPSVEGHQAVAEALAAKGLARAVTPGAERDLLVEDYYVFTRSRMMSGEAVMLQCWGAYTRFLCTRPDEPA